MLQIDSTSRRDKKKIITIWRRFTSAEFYVNVYYHFASSVKTKMRPLQLIHLLMKDKYEAIVKIQFYMNKKTPFDWNISVDRTEFSFSSNIILSQAHNANISLQIHSFHSKENDGKIYLLEKLNFCLFQQIEFEWLLHVEVHKTLLNLHSLLVVKRKRNILHIFNLIY